MRAKIGFAGFVCLILPVAMPTAASAQNSDPIEEVLSIQFPGSEVIDEDRRSYDSAAFATGVGRYQEPETKIDAEGKVATVEYAAPVETAPLEIIRSYQRALEGVGFETLYDCNKTCGSLGGFTRAQGMDFVNNYDEMALLTAEREADGKRTLVSVGSTLFNWSDPANQKNQFYVRVLSTDATVREATILTADDIAKAISSDGAAAIYGLEFATGSAELQSASKPVLDQMAGYLKANPGAEILLVGHTDDQGAFGLNMSLSRDRAEAVKTALVTDYRIEASRLDAHGVGYLAPKASNASAEGKAKNRRVEMVLK